MDPLGFGKNLNQRLREVKQSRDRVGRCGGDGSPLGMEERENESILEYSLFLAWQLDGLSIQLR